MSSVNKVILIGRVGQDPEIKDTNSGIKIANFSLATSEKYKDEEKTQWHRCVAFGKLTGVIESYVKKGDLLYIEGTINYESWEKDGETKYATKIKVWSIQMLGSKSSPTEEPKTTTPAPIDKDVPF